MADNNNPIKYSDLVSPDNSITDLIKQLVELSGVSRQTKTAGTQPRKPQTMRNVWHVRNVIWRLQKAITPKS